MESHGSTPPASPRHAGEITISFSQHSGLISLGGTILQARMTVEQAKLKAEGMQECEGFTFKGSPSGLPVEIYFKAKWDLRGISGWTSYRKDKTLVGSC